MKTDAELDEMSALAEEEVKRDRKQATREFDRLCADYLRLLAEQFDPDRDHSDEALDERCNRRHELRQSIITAEAICPRHLDFKFDIMREVREEDSGNISVSFLESIRGDALGNWCLDD